MRWGGQRLVQLVNGGWTDLLKIAYGIGLAHLLVSIVFVQGLTYSSQFVIARLISPAEFGIVRNVEAVLSILSIVAAAGMPSLAVKSIAEVKDPVLRGRLLGRLLELSVITSCVFGVATLLVAPRFVSAQALPYFEILVGLLLVRAISRTCVNYLQGINEFQRMSVLNAVLSLASLAFVTVAVMVAGLNGWVAGRYIGEALFAVGGIVAVAGGISLAGRLPASYRVVSLLTLGITIAISQVVRVAFENSAVIMLGALSVGTDEIGYYGLSTLIVGAAILVPAAACQLALPRMVQRATAPAEAWALYLRVMGWCLFATVLTTLLLVVASPLIRFVFGVAYAPAVPMVSILACVVPLRAITLVDATLLLAYDKADLTLAVNAVLLATAVGLYLLAIPTLGAIGAAVVTLGVEAVSAVAFTFVTRWVHQARAGSLLGR